MVERGWGRVINVSSVNGQKGAFGQTNYSAAKAGMHGFTKALALEVARKGVTVNTISPGYIGTKMVTAIPKEILDSQDPAADPDRPARQARGSRRPDHLPVLGRSGVRHRRQHRDQRRPAHVLRSRLRLVALARSRTEDGKPAPADQEVPEPPAVRHARRRATSRSRTSSRWCSSRRVPGRRREDRRRPDARDPAADHPRGGVGRHADVHLRHAVADHPLLRQRACRASWARTSSRTSRRSSDIQKRCRTRRSRSTATTRVLAGAVDAVHEHAGPGDAGPDAAATSSRAEAVHATCQQRMQNQTRSMFTGLPVPRLRRAPAHAAEADTKAERRVHDAADARKST